MTPEDIYLAIRGADSSYRFVCPGCALIVEKAADRKVIALLLSAGVNLGDGTTPEPSVRPGNQELPPLTRDDLRSFHELLRQDDFLAAMADGS